MRNGLRAAMASLAIVAELGAQGNPLLQLKGQPYFGGSMTLHLKASAAVGQPALLAYGLNPLTTPIQTGKGPWYIGSLVNLMSIGAIPAGGRIDLPFTMPPLMPAFAGLPIVMHGYVSGQLSNPAMLRLDVPYLETQVADIVTAPVLKSGGKFGDRVRTGDLDGDGLIDLVVGAAYEKYLGVSNAGRVYVMWGPDWIQSTALNSPVPTYFKLFGFGLAVADFDLDGIDDVAISELCSDPPAPTDFGAIYVSFGTADRALDLDVMVPSPGGGVDAASIGRCMAAGDVTGDGIPDVVVGDSSASLGAQAFSGALMILPGPSVDAPWIISNPTPAGSDFFGNWVRLEDMNADGFLDVIEGSGRADVLDLSSSIVNAGEIHVLYGPSLTTWESFHSPLGLAFDDRFGDVIGTADLDGDGRPEIATTNNHDVGFIIWGDREKPISSLPKPPVLFTNPLGDTAFGYSMLCADVNRDGLQDVLFGDSFDGTLSSCPIASTGCAFAALGPYFSTFHIVAEPLPGCGDTFTWVMERGDVNADGTPDLVLSAPTADVSGVSNAGKVVVLYGTP